MRRIKELKKSLFALVCLFCGLQISGGIAQADTLTLTPAGLKHLDEIQKMLHPAPVYESSRGEKYFYGLIIDAYSAPDPAAPWQSLKGRPHYKVIAFDTRGVNRSQAVVLSSFWVKPFNTIDTLLDLRTYASNRDVIYNTYIGSRKYMASLLQAIDPNGTLGLVPTGSSSTHESKGLVKGALELFLCKPFGRGEEDEYFLTMNQMLKERRPLITAPHGMRYLGDGSGLAYSIAKARKYPVYEPGFERAAMALLLLRTNLITVDPTRSECSNFLYQHGLLTTRTLIKLVRAANPRPLEKKDSRLESIDRRLAKETNPEEKKNC